MNRIVMILGIFLIFIFTIVFISINKKGVERETETIKQPLTDQHAEDP